MLVDDRPAIHEDFRKILGTQATSPGSLVDLDAALFGGAPNGPGRAAFEMNSAHQGREALSKVKQAPQPAV